MHFVNAKGILSSNDGMNIYRGCTHGCIYCDSRSLCYHIEHRFEDIEVKQNAPAFLLRTLKNKRKKCMIGTGSMCDPYMHCERELGLTGKCLEIIRDYGFGLSILTKSDMILRDIDLLDEINKKAKCVVQMTLTTFDEEICKTVEPNVCTTHRRYEVLKIMRERGIPTVVWFSPILPFINDTEENLRGILGYCFDAGVKGIIYFGAGTTMRDGDREYFYSALDKSFPGLKNRYKERYGNSYICESDNEAELTGIFHSECEKHGVLHDNDTIFAYLRSLYDAEAVQCTMFDGE